MKYKVIKPFDEFIAGDLFERTEPDGITAYYSCHTTPKDSALVPEWLLASMPEYFEEIKDKLPKHNYDLNDVADMLIDTRRMLFDIYERLTATSVKWWIK